MTTTIRLRGPADIITVLPYHLGYRPSDSLVVVLLDGPRVGMVARLDLPPPHVDPQLVVDELLPYVLRERPDRVVLVGFESRPGQAQPAGSAMHEALVDAGIDTVERLLVRDGRWWCQGGDEACCPPEGEVLPPDDRVPAVADYVVLGRQPAASRDGLAERLAYTDDPAQDARCAALIHELESVRRRPRPLQRRRRRVLEAWGRVLSTDLTPEEDWAWAVVGLLDVPVRDLLIAWLCPGTLELDVFPLALRRLAATHLPARDGASVEESDLAGLDGLDGLDGPAGLDGLAAFDPSVGADGMIVARLAAACRRSPPELSPGPLTVLGHVAWWQGDGALARTAVERALAVDPGYRLAVLLQRMVDVAARPSRSA